MWRVFSASVTGTRNLEQGAHGQDASHSVMTEHLLVAVVCDGAGSVQEGRAGAEFFARRLAELLPGSVPASNELPEALPPGERLEAIVRSAIETVRMSLAAVAASRDLLLTDYSCTLVGCVATPLGGCLFHIGDGFAIQQIGSGECILSQPENGEFADETYFVTDHNWSDHLRFTVLPAPGTGCVIGLMSDGTAPFAVNRARSGFYPAFIDPIITFLRASTAPIGNSALKNLLESPRACEISADDKTLLLAIAT